MSSNQQPGFETPKKCATKIDVWAKNPCILWHHMCLIVHCCENLENSELHGDCPSCQAVQTVSDPHEELVRKSARCFHKGFVACYPK